MRLGKYVIRVDRRSLLIMKWEEYDLKILLSAVMPKSKKKVDNTYLPYGYNAQREALREQLNYELFGKKA